tara:strand:+ start:192 stop:608 length:417 start_codon:yes stop_codon:yes gene_type:complete
MTSLEIWLAIVLLLFVTATAILVWYLRRLLIKFLWISENIGDLVEMVQNYQDHLKKVYNMETYVGDPAIEYLIKHTNSLIDMLEDYKDVYDITDPLLTNQENNINDDREQAQEEETPEEPGRLSEENVFYAGSRRRDS